MVRLPVIAAVAMALVSPADARPTRPDNSPKAVACRKKARAAHPEKWKVVSRTTFRDHDGVEQQGWSSYDTNWPGYQRHYRACMQK
jgi:hypothetical protein